MRAPPLSREGNEGLVGEGVKDDPLMAELLPPAGTWVGWSTEEEAPAEEGSIRVPGNVERFVLALVRYGLQSAEPLPTPHAGREWAYRLHTNENRRPE